MVSQPTIYIVDDDAAVRDSLSNLFRVIGLSVRSYASAKAFLEELPVTGSGCLITDVHMKVMSGLQLLQRLKTLKSRLPVIVITGRTSSTLTADAMAAGAIALIEKPFGSDEIVGAVLAAVSANVSGVVRPQRL